MARDTGRRNLDESKVIVWILGVLYNQVQECTNKFFCYLSKVINKIIFESLIIILSFCLGLSIQLM